MSDRVESGQLGAVVVGTSFGARVHVPALRGAGFRVEALVGRDPERTSRRAERLGVPRAMTSLDVALALDGVDVVTIAAPPHEHAPLVLAALAAGKHVVCEKPFALDAAEARAMAAAADRAAVVAVVGHEFRYAPERALGERLIADGAIGEPRLASFVGYVPLVADTTAAIFSEWWFDPGRGGGWLGASGSHLVDHARSWLGELDLISATTDLVSDRDRAATADDAFTLTLRARASGATAVLQQTGGAWGPAVALTRVAGTRGSIWIDGGDVWLADQTGTRIVDVPDDLTLPPGPPPLAGAHQFSHLELMPYTRLCERLHDAIAAGATIPAGAATFDDGVAVMEILDAARDDARRRTRGRPHQGSP
jgi:predicted dehydrogenase